ncbi:MAG TPA: sugar ABC transporter ATP-binding protein [Solirubrobacterales bacterium]|nr:sugar ABC transporter ATP-binding protein [Solirubrobacterales bacterium]
MSREGDSREALLSRGEADRLGVVLEAEHVSKAFGATRALDDVSLRLEKGSVHALLGGNGSGKSTLIKAIAGVQPADAGTLALAGGRHHLPAMTPARAREAGLHFVHQQRAVFPGLSVLENLALGRGFETAAAGRIDWRRARQRTAAVLERFQIAASPDQELGELGPATQAMVAIARALQDQDDSADGILLLDEPTASLPAPEAALLLEALRRYADAGQAIVYVTHRLEEVFAVADRATLLRDGRVVGVVEPRSLDHEALVELMMGRSVEQIERLRGRAGGPTVLAARGLAAGPLAPLDLDLRAGEIVGLGGLIGSGRSSLLRALFGAAPLDSGEVRVDGERRRLDSPAAAMAAGLAYVPEDRQADGAFPELGVGENLSLTVLPDYWHRGVLNRRRERRDALGLFDSFLIVAESAAVPLRTLSGGNQQKVVLARWLRRQPRVLLLDEPTQGVDVAARAEIYELVHRAVAGGAAALIASSDFEELARLCDRVIVLRRGEAVAELDGEDLDADRIAALANAKAPA